MKIGILRFGLILPEVLVAIEQSLVTTFPDTTCTVVSDLLPLPQKAWDKKREQYQSGALLSAVRSFEAKHKEFSVILGVADADIFADNLNYVFGEAYTPGKAALISLWRLKPEFYGEQPNQTVYDLRALKEALHEIGHTLGLQHCPRSHCVMHFSNSIFDTDRKQSLFCDQCYLQAALQINKLR